MSSVPTPLFRPAAAVVGVGPWVALAYLLLYLALDWVSFIHPMRGFNITPWNPQSALAVALLVWRPRAWWLVWVGLVLAANVVRGEPASWAPEMLATVLLAFGYAVTAAALRRWLGPGVRIATRTAFLVFVAVVAAGALLDAVLYVAALGAFGIPTFDRVLPAVWRAWIGDAVGFLVTLPLLFVLGSRERRRATAAMLRTVEWWLLTLVAVGLAYAVFGRSTEELFKFFYLLFLPVVWGAARFGVVGAVGASALVQLLLIVAVQSLPYRPLTVFELQVLMAALAATGLLLGTTVDEREEAQRALQASLHLAAAGDMAAALAHELNQPLTALSAYARASQLLARRLGAADEGSAHPLAEVTGKLVGEANRASEVVGRLRDFFRERATELQPTDLAALVREVVEAQAAHAAAMHVRLDVRCEAPLPAVWLDRVQIAVVLRNLVANALDAARQSARPDAWVAVRAHADTRQLTVEVHDSGPGLPVEDVTRVFESRRSSKPGGMGIGLGISRAIVLAHGGRLWAEPGPGGRFAFCLPLTTPHAHD
ncbi:MAG TPA: ATP-binding protein [Albitalea sp.]